MEKSTETAARGVFAAFQLAEQRMNAYPCHININKCLAQAVSKIDWMGQARLHPGGDGLPPAPTQQWL